MRLTNYIRDAFVEAAMQDVPKIDYNAQAEKIAKDEANRLFSTAFPDVDLNKVKGWFDGGTLGMPGGLQTIHFHARTEYYMLREKSPKVWERLVKISEQQKEQSTKMDALRIKLKGAANACTTTKQLRELLPEFDKYLPEEEAPSARSLPVVANIVADFAKAGWPKKDSKKLAA